MNSREQFTNSQVHSEGVTVHAAEAAFAIDHIRKAIISELDLKSVLNCRLVCSSWAYFASLDLQKVVTLTFTKPKWRQQSQIAHTFNLQKNSGKSLEELMTLMDTSVRFPCSSFAFFDTDEIEPFAETFFSQFGPMVTKLELIGSQSFRGHGRSCWSPIYAEDVHKLLFTQLPNLEHLVLRGCIRFKTSPPEAAELQLPGSDVTLSLKKIEFSETFPETFLREILDASPNLREVEVDIKNVGALLKPRNRFHLVKTLKASVTNATLDLLTRIVCNNICQGQNQLSIRTLIFRGAFHPVNHKASGWPEAADVILKLLEGCSLLCETLEWHQMSFLRHFRFPPMPSITDLTIVFYGMSGGQSPTFRLNGSLKNTFPKLTTICLKIKHRPCNEVSSSGDDSDNREDYNVDELFCDVEPVESVRVVYSDWLYSSSETYLPQDWRRLFPNAKLLKTIQ